MKNTGCSACSEDFERTRVIELLGKPLRLRAYGCAPTGGDYVIPEGPLKVQLTLMPTTYCPAACPFCIAAPHDRRDAMDLRPLEALLPDVARLDRIVSMVFDVFGHDMEITLDTNGMGLHHLQEIRELPHVDTVHISRHHYDDEANFRIFGTRAVPTAAALRRAIGGISYKDLFVMNCMLMKDHIGTPEAVRRYLDFAAGLGAGKVAFITATPVNGFARAQAVRFDDVISRDDPSMLFTRGFHDFEWCRCQDGVYCSGNGLIEFYGRSTDARACDYCRGLVFGPDNRLRSGFGGAVIWE